MKKTRSDRKHIASICACGETAWMTGSKATVVLVDADDFPILNREPWKRVGQGYFLGFHCAKKLHRVIMGVENPEVCVDHRNWDKGDNRKKNLRLCNRTESIRNRRRLQMKNPGRQPSRFKGVTCQSGGWVARIAVDGVRLYLGVFPDEESAALAYDAAAREHHGEFAATNF